MTHNHQTWRIEDLYLSRAGTCLLKVEELQLQRGCLHILMGSNGAGKTSLLRTLHSLEPTGRWSSDPAFRTERQAMVFQKPVFLKDTVAANLALALCTENAAQAPHLQIAERLAQVGLQGAENRMARSLSGGEQQRLALARALLRSPSLLLLDEPTSNLDTTATQAFESVLMSTLQQGCTLLMSTHSLAQAKRLAQRVLFMDKGSIVETSAQPQVFFQQPVSPQARDFFGQM